MGDPKFAAKVSELGRRLLERPGHLDPAIRRAAANGSDVPDVVAGYVDRVRRHAYRVTDEEVAALLEAGWTEDQVFELTLAAAYGAALRRLDAGLDAMGQPADDAGRGQGASG